MFVKHIYEKSQQTSQHVNGDQTNAQLNRKAKVSYTLSPKMVITTIVQWIFFFKISLNEISSEYDDI